MLGVKLVVLLFLAVVVAGCNGGTVDRHALTNDAATIDSIDCEAWLLSQAMTEGRLTSVYAREQAEVLRLQAANFADALGKRATAAGLEKRVRAKSREAAVLAGRLQRLRDAPASGETEQLSRAFKRAGSCS
jgi:hypothetical protein